ncbi:MAG: YqhA family protein [Mariprofundaceae bacterium]|nr:YqhA family protein [Mariprofundaceae bacterium]
MKNFFEKLLWSSRYLTLLAVWSCIAGMAMLFVLSAIDMSKLLLEFIDVYFLGHEVEHFHTIVVSHVITAVDDFLLAMVLLIFALGVYELFISKLDFAREKDTAGSILQIKSLDDLKDRLGKVILMILIVSFFKNVLTVKFDDPLNILYMGGGIALVALASYLGHKGSGH